MLDKTPHSFTSDFTYELEIQTSDQITNVTFYLPLPVKNGVPTVGMQYLKEDDFKKENLLVGIVRSPPDLILDGEYPSQENEQLYLKISSNHVYLNKTLNSEYIVRIENLTWPKTPLLFADTLDPFVNETVFLPKLKFSPSTPMMNNQTSANWIRYSSKDTSYIIPVYADYSASPLTKVHIRSTINGGNSWRYYDDSGGVNSYWDYYEWDHIGESHGWQNADGTYKSAQGVYPNLDHPEWQKVLNRTV